MMQWSGTRAMPNRFHQHQYAIVGVLALVAMVLYFFSPPAKSEGFVTMAMLCLGFVVGKFTNGFTPRGKE